MDITGDKEYDIRYTTKEDHPFLLRCMQLPDVVRYLPVETELEVENMAKNWIGFAKYRASITAVYKNKPIGIATLFLFPYKKTAHLSMFYFVVEERYRRKKVGTSLIKNLKNLAKNSFRLERIHAELFSGCHAIPLLEKMGFYTVFEQEKYVKEKDGYLSRLILETKDKL